MGGDINMIKRFISYSLLAGMVGRVIISVVVGPPEAVLLPVLNRVPADVVQVTVLLLLPLVTSVDDVIGNRWPPPPSPGLCCVS